MDFRGRDEAEAEAFLGVRLRRQTEGWPASLGFPYRRLLQLWRKATHWKTWRSSGRPQLFSQFLQDEIGMLEMLLRNFKEFLFFSALRKHFRYFLRHWKCQNNSFWCYFIQSYSLFERSIIFKPLSIIFNRKTVIQNGSLLERYRYSLQALYFAGLQIWQKTARIIVIQPSNEYVIVMSYSQRPKKRIKQTAACSGL